MTGFGMLPVQVCGKASASLPNCNPPASLSARMSRAIDSGAEQVPRMAKLGVGGFHAESGFLARFRACARAVRSGAGWVRARRRGFDRVNAKPRRGCERPAERGGTEAAETGRQGRTAAQPTRVYLLRGLWNVWSYGMDDLANKLRAVGVDAVVVNHSAWPQIADMLIKQRASGEYTGPIVLVGHSLGGDDVIRTAQALGAANVPVDLLVPVDAVTPL